MKHQDASESDYPLGRTLTDVSQKDRVAMVSDPDQLYRFVIESFKKTFPLADAIDQTLTQFRSRE